MKTIFKRTFFISFCLLLSANCFSQGWEWIKLVQPFNNFAGMRVKVGPDGNVYGAGGFTQSIDLGNGHVVNGNSDGYVSMFDTAGACQWAQKVAVTTQGCGCTIQGNTSYAVLAGFDGSGNAIVYGGYCGCGGTFGSGITTPNGGYNLFLAKYSPTGTCLWVKIKPGSFNSTTGQTFDDFYTATIDNADNIYISMFNYATTTNFCGLSFSNQGSYLLKVNTNGIGIWNKQTGSLTNGYTIAQMEGFNKKIYAYSGFIGTCVFGTTTLTAQGSVDIATLKMDTAGNYLAATDIGSSGNQTGAYSLAVSNNRVVLLANSYSSSVTIGTYTLNTGTGKDKTFLVSYDTSLNVKKYRSTANDSLGSGSALYNDNKGNIYVTVTNTATTGFGNLNNVPAGRHVIKMNDTLTNYWHLESVSTCVAPDTLGNLYIVDSFNSSANYGPFTNTSSGHGITLGKINNAYGVGLQSRATQNNSLSVYPNPGDGLFNLKTGSTIKSKRGINIILYDGTGKQIENVPFTLTDDYTLQINLSSYTKGLYMVKAEVDGVLYSAKLER